MTSILREEWIDSELALAMAVIALVFLAVLAILRKRGLRVQLSACLFIVSLVVTQLMMKELSSPPFSYRFPACVSTLHFCSMWFVCLVYWVLQRDVRKCQWRSIGSAERYALTILPIACSLPLSVILSNRAMLYVGAAVNAVIATLAPVTTAALSHVCGRTLAPAAWLGVFIACCGAIEITWAETRIAATGGQSSSSGQSKGMDSLIMRGIVYALGAVLTRSIKAVMQDTLLKPGAASSSQPLSPLHLWALQAPPCSLVSAVIAALTEDCWAALTELTPEIVGVILCTCCFATMLNLTGMFTIRDLGASSMQLVGKLNTLVTMALSVALLGETLPREAVLGTGIVLTGVAVFEWGDDKQHSGTERKLPR